MRFSNRFALLLLIAAVGAALWLTAREKIILWNQTDAGYVRQFIIYQGQFRSLIIHSDRTIVFSTITPQTKGWEINYRHEVAFVNCGRNRDVQGGGDFSGVAPKVVYGRWQSSFVGSKGIVCFRSRLEPKASSGYILPERDLVAFCFPVWPVNCVLIILTLGVFRRLAVRSLKS